MRNVFWITALLFGALVIPSAKAQTEIVATTSSYDSIGYDYVTTLPPSTYQNIGAFTFTIPAGFNVGGVTISGSFGNTDGTTAALSDYYLGYAGDEEAVEVAACDDISQDCYSGQEGPYPWMATLTQAQIADLAPAIAAGSIDFGYTWDSSPPAQPISDPFFSSTAYDAQYVYAGAATLDITPTPEPETGLLWLTGLIGLAAFWRVRKHSTFGSPK
jgi:hypothetical protein